MVSQPQPEYTRVTTTRAPSSIVSRSSRRRHGHGRSHTGGSSYLPQNEFPVFSHTGDVEITLRAGNVEKRYLLHRLILSQCSGFFQAGTAQAWSKATDERKAARASSIAEDSVPANTAHALQAPRQRWTYELDKGTGNDDVPILVQKDNSALSRHNALPGGPPEVRNKPSSSNAAFFRSVANLSLSQPSQVQPLSPDDEDLLRDYDNMFRIFYNHAPVLDSINVAEAYVQCKSLLNVADQYDSLDVVGPRIDHHLLQFQSRLWKQIAKYPPSYLKLGYLARSRSIYAEALIHVVGQWPMGERHIRHSLPERVLDVIEDKVDELEDTVARIEGRLFRLTLHTSRGERVSPSNGLLDFLAVSYFRNWLADMTSPPSPPSIPKTSSSRHGRHQGRHTAPPPPPYTPGSIAPHSGHTFRLIGSADQTAYLGHDDCKKLLKCTHEQYSRDNLKKLERRLGELKELAREIVKPLMRCELQSDAPEGIGYLMCTRISEDDYCWEV